jgi:hypothetical protein
MQIIYFFISAIIGFLIAKIVCGKYEGDKPERSLRFSISKYYLHIHHWIYCSVVLIILSILKFYNPFIFGFLMGITIQGLFYKDKFVILYKKQDYQKIYQK